MASKVAVGPDDHVRGVAEQHRGEWWAEAVLSLLNRIDALENLEVAVNEMVRWETPLYSKDPGYWTAIRKDTYAAVLKAMPNG